MGWVHVQARLRTDGGMETARLQAQVGRLVAEVGQLEDDRTEMAACIRSMEADQAYHAASTKALEERVASLAADLVCAEGRAEAASRHAAQQVKRIEQLEALLRKPAHAQSMGCTELATAQEPASPGGNSRLPEAAPGSPCSVEEPPTPARSDDASVRCQQLGRPPQLVADEAAGLVQHFWTAGGRAAFVRGLCAGCVLQAQSCGRCTLLAEACPGEGPLLLMLADTDTVLLQQDLEGGQQGLMRTCIVQDLQAAAMVLESQDTSACHIADHLAATTLHDAILGKAPAYMRRSASVQQQVPHNMRLGFAHAVMPTIIDRGRELANHLAADFEPAQVKPAAGIDKCETPAECKA